MVRRNEPRRVPRLNRLALTLSRSTRILFTRRVPRGSLAHALGARCLLNVRTLNFGVEDRFRLSIVLLVASFDHFRDSALPLTRQSLSLFGLSGSLPATPDVVSSEAVRYLHISSAAPIPHPCCRVPCRSPHLPGV